MNERELMHFLQERFRLANVQSELCRMAEELLGQLRMPANQEKSAFANVPLDLYGGGLPSELRSSWLFALRGGIEYPPERHPNSIQRMFAHSETGKFDTWDGTQWITHELVPGDGGLSIPVDTWHRMPMSQREDWVVVSFHTAEPNELIEIIGDPTAGPAESERLYLPREVG